MDLRNYQSNQLVTEISNQKVNLFYGPDGRKRELFSKQLSDKLIESVATIDVKTRSLSNFCKAGCSHCCCHFFKTTSTEATAITYYLLTNEEILSKFIDNFIAIQNNYPYKLQLREECDPSDREQTKEANDKYFQQKIPCDFLVDGLCIIYETRPLVCSAYIAFAPGRICSFEPKGYIPKEINKVFLDTKYWFEVQARIRYKGQPESITNWSQRIIENLLTGDF